MLKTKTKWLGSPWVLAGVLAVTVGASTDAAAQAVKKSSSGICHCPGGQFYDRTTNFTEYETLEACLDSGGREPRRGQVDCRMESSSDATANAATGPLCSGGGATRWRPVIARLSFPKTAARFSVAAGWTPWKRP